MNTFEQLVDDLDTGKISLTVIHMAIRAHVRNSKHTPEEAKDILCGSGDNNPGLIYLQFRVLSETIGAFELVVRRAKD